jgi:cytochrome b-561
VRTSAILALLVFFLMSTLAGYKIDFQQQGSLLGNNAVLWTLVLGGPLLTFFLAYALMRIFYGKKEEEKAL